MGEGEEDEEEGGRRLHAFIQASQAGRLGPLNMPVAMATPFQPPLLFSPFFFIFFLSPMSK